ncbi:interleukin-8-like isoform 1-T1 [Ara ararauna]
MYVFWGNVLGIHQTTQAMGETQVCYFGDGARAGLHDENLHLAILEVNGNLNCRCIKTTSDYMSPKRYESIEIRPVGSTCRRTEIIIKLKTSGKVCVNPDAPWVKKLLKRIASTKKK